MTRQEFDALPSNGAEKCPDCGTRGTMPYPNCGCPLAPGGFTRHVNKWHHQCPPRNTASGNYPELGAGEPA